MKDLDKMPVIGLFLLLGAMGVRCSVDSSSPTTGPWLLTPAGDSKYVVDVNPRTNQAIISSKRNNSAQMWYYVPTDKNSDEGTITNKGSINCLGTASDDKNNQTSVIAEPCHPNSTKGQVWRKNHSRLVNTNSDKCLAIQYGRITEGAALTQFDCAADPTQLWQFIES
jgi:hypothetical protein